MTTPSRRETDSASTGPDPRVPDPVAANCWRKSPTTWRPLPSGTSRPAWARPNRGRRPAKAFGDVAQIGRRCYWIKQGDTLHVSRHHCPACSPFLAVGLIAVTVRSWQAESRMAEQMSRTDGPLGELAERAAGAAQAAAAPSRAD